MNEQIKQALEKSIKALQDLQFIISNKSDNCLSGKSLAISRANKAINACKTVLQEEAKEKS